jgi:putative DNA primase/helicase
VKAAEIHARLGSSGWSNVLARLGVPAEALRNRHGACPACGGKDRFRFDNKRGRGDFICNQCGAGDGFALLMRVRGCDFATARREIIQAAGLVDDERNAGRAFAEPARTQVARPTQRVLRIVKSSCSVESCDEAVAYLQSRRLWPLPAGHNLRAHASVEYWVEGTVVGRYAALLGLVRDLAGELVTVHVTYLDGGRKLARHEPRKILSPLTGREGCAVRLLPLAGDVLGVAEGIETALSAATTQRIPVWAALNASLLARFDLPAGVSCLRIYADRDAPGFESAARLMERLQGKVRVEFCPPPVPHKDWNDARVAT